MARSCSGSCSLLGCHREEDKNGWMGFPCFSWGLCLDLAKLGCFLVLPHTLLLLALSWEEQVLVSRSFSLSQPTIRQAKGFQPGKAAAASLIFQPFLLQPAWDGLGSTGIPPDISQPSWASSPVPLGAGSGGQGGSRVPVRGCPGARNRGMEDALALHKGSSTEDALGLGSSTGDALGLSRSTGNALQQGSSTGNALGLNNSTGDALEQGSSAGRGQRCECIPPREHSQAAAAAWEPGEAEFLPSSHPLADVSCFPAPRAAAAPHRSMSSISSSPHPWRGDGVEGSREERINISAGPGKSRGYFESGIYGLLGIRNESVLGRRDPLIQAEGAQMSKGKRRRL